MDIFPPDVQEASEKLASNWLKASEFEAGLTLQLTKPLEKVKSNFGATLTDYLVENNILEEGESFRYTFVDAEGVEKKIDSASSTFFIAFKQCEEAGVGDWFLITRTGAGKNTRYTVERVEVPVSRAKGEIAPEEVAF